MDNFHPIQAKQQALMAKSVGMPRPMNTKEVQAMLEKNDFALRSWMLLQKHEPSPANTKEVKAWFSKCSMIRQQIAARLEVLASLADSQIAREENLINQPSASGAAATTSTTKRGSNTGSSTNAYAQMPNRPPDASGVQMMARMGPPIVVSTALTSADINLSQSVTPSMSIATGTKTTVVAPNVSVAASYSTTAPTKTMASAYMQASSSPSVVSTGAPVIASLPPLPFLGNDFEQDPSAAFNPTDSSNEPFANVSSNGFPDPMPFYNASIVPNVSSSSSSSSSFEPTPFVNAAPSGYSMPMMTPMTSYSMTPASTNTPNTTSSVSQPMYVPPTSSAYGMPYQQQQRSFNPTAMQLSASSQPFAPSSSSMMMTSTSASSSSMNPSVSMVNAGSTASYGYTGYNAGGPGGPGMPIPPPQQPYGHQSMGNAMMYGNVSGPMASTMSISGQQPSSAASGASYQSMSTDSLIEEFFS